MGFYRGRGSIGIFIQMILRKALLKGGGQVASRTFGDHQVNCFFHFVLLALQTFLHEWNDCGA